MPLLSNASISNAMFSESIIKVLSTNKVITTLDFLREDLDKLATITKLTLPDILAVRTEIFNKYSAPLVNAGELIEQDSYDRHVLLTGIESLDNILGGGLPLGHITEVCGLAGVGKTQLCLKLCINCAQIYDSNVLYIDTKGDFSSCQLQSYLESSGLSIQKRESIMMNIKVIRIWNMEELVQLFNTLKKDTDFIHSVKLIIIDSLPSLMFQHHGEKCKIGLSLLNVFVNSARYLSRKLNLSIVCVNLITRWMEQDLFEIEAEQNLSEAAWKEKQIRCMGRYWQHIPAIVLLLEKHKTQNSDDHFEVLIRAIKSFNKDSSGSCNFIINL